MNSRFKLILAIGLVVSLFTASFSAAAQDNDNNNDVDDFDVDIHYDHEFALPQFYDVWERTDYPVQQLEVARTWIWGPGPITGGLQEEYAEAEGEERLVQYFDKSRMEEPIEGADPESPWFITQGLLAIELMTGNMQVGNEAFVQYEPAEIPVAGDWTDQTGPTYAAMGEYIDWDPRPQGSTITQVMDREGNISDNEDLAQYEVTDYYYITQTDHNIASVFWDFMESEGLIYVDGDYTTGPIFTNEFYAIGYPVTEAYWGWVTVDGVDQNVLIQCFERRCLTYAPDNPEGWEVESGNVGLHYYMWRYHIVDEPIEPVEPELSLALSPEDATNEVDTQYTLTATLMENGDAIAIDAVEDVSVAVTRDNGENDNGVEVDVEETITLTNAGAAEISYTGPEEPAVDTINVEVEYGDETVSASTTKTWQEVAVDPEVSITLDPAEATNPYFGQQGIEVFEEEIAAWVGFEYDLEEGSGAWDDLTDEQRQDILDAEIADFWLGAVGHEAPNWHTVEAEVSVDDDVVQDGNVDVVIEVDDETNGDEVWSGEVAIENGVATISYDASGFGSTDASVDHNIIVTYEDESATATKTWVPFADYEYEAEPTYLFLDHYFNQETEEPALPVGPVDDWHDAIATLLDQFGQPIEGENLVFSVDGVNDDPEEWTSYDPADIATVQWDPDPWDGETNEQGQRAFSYLGTNTGDDTMRVDVADEDVDLFAELTKTWIDAEPVALEEGDVETQTAENPDQFVDPPFTYYVVRNLPEYQQALYHEPERLGDEVFVLEGSDAEAYWFGVSAPDPDTGMQSEIVHQGTATLYMEVSDGEWVSLTAEFDDEGELIEVNGITP